MITALNIALVGSMLFSQFLLLHAQLHLRLDGGVCCLCEAGIEALHSLLELLKQAIELFPYLTLNVGLLVLVVTVQSLQLILLLLSNSAKLGHIELFIWTLGSTGHRPSCGRQELVQTHWRDYHGCEGLSRVTTLGLDVVPSNFACGLAFFG